MNKMIQTKKACFLFFYTNVFQIFTVLLLINPRQKRLILDIYHSSKLESESRFSLKN